MIESEILLICAKIFDEKKTMIANDSLVVKTSARISI